MTGAARRWRTRDGIILVLLGVYAAFDLGVGTYWLAHAYDLPALAATGGRAQLFAWFAAADRGYFDAISQGPLALVTIDVTIVLCASLILAIGIIRGTPYRIALQIAVGGYGVYAVVIVWWTAVLSGFPTMEEKTVSHVLLYFGARLPWLLGYAFIAGDGIALALRASRGEPDTIVVGHDKTTIGLVIFFIAVAMTAELYYVTHAFHMTAYHDAFRDVFEIYGIGDRGYFDQASWFEVGLETFHIAITVPAYLVLIWAILARRPIRWPLQVCIGSYVSMSVMVYFAGKHMTGYAQMPKHDAFSFFMFVAPNLPWLLGNLFLAYEAGRAITETVRARSQTPLLGEPHVFRAGLSR